MEEKKINNEEAMSEEELEKVAGGNRDELALDTQLFNAMGGRIQAYDLYDINNTNYRSISSRITDLYAKAGITVKYNDSGASSYYDSNGNGISRNAAVDKVAFNLGYHDFDTSPFKI